MKDKSIKSSKERTSKQRSHPSGETRMLSRKVGIVIISHNASMTVRITLASLRQAKNETGAKVILVDNASDEIERGKIRSALERHTQEASLPWVYLQQDKNLGFSGGNNVGIKRFLDDPEISHICLLNSDVIVTDHWMDQLLSTECDIVSGVTNKADSEQWIPVDYNVSMEECFDEKNETVRPVVWSRISSFARDWHEAWSGNLVEGEATFFCVLIKKSVFQELGLLDETFFPGGYDDEDFCIRARRQGFKVQLARDVYIHHWGSSSFGQLQRDYFYDNAQRNRKYLEDKHGIVRRRRPERPFISYLMDIKFAAKQKGNRTLQQRFNRLYIAQLGREVTDFESEFKNLHQMVKKSDQKAPPTLIDQIERARRSGNLIDTWKRIVTGANVVFSENIQSREFIDNLVGQFEHFIEALWARVECNFTMHAFLFPSEKPERNATSTKTGQSSAPTPTRVGSTLVKLFRLLKRGIPFLWNLRGIVFFGGYPYPERQSDGYFQRVRMVDRLFVDRWRIYIESGRLPGRDQWFDRPEPKVLVLRVSTRSLLRNVIARVLALMLILRCQRVYFHSIYSMISKSVRWLIYMPGLIKVIDIHGVVPEEFRFHDDYYNAVFHERVEQTAVRHSDLIIVVTKAMSGYLKKKYRENLRGEIILFPMFPSYPSSTASRPSSSRKPVIVYAGGIQKWQQVPKMIDAISRTASLYRYRFYCPSPARVREMLPEQIRSQVIVDHKSHDELLSLYSECHYGFVLREDNIVNRVACPTKLTEYLAMGIVPIVDSEHIGDFKSLGAQFVRLEELLHGRLPSEAQQAEMARVNLTVYERLHEIYKQGANDIRAMLSNQSLLVRKGMRLLVGIKYLLPLRLRQAQVTRSLVKFLRGIIYGRRRTNTAQNRDELPDTHLMVASPLPKTDVFVQVDNFEAGGLENIAIDLNDALISAGYKVTMAVLGHAGAGVKTARERGMFVLTDAVESYSTLIENINPKLVLAHYSIHGIEMLHERHIPTVQVIQNAYMWLDDEQRRSFGRAANLTTVFVALSEYAKQYSVNRLGVDENCCVVLPCGIDCASFDAFDKLEVRRELRGNYGINEQDFVFLSVGAINHQKNHIATVRAFASVAEKLPLAKLIILGPAYEENLLKEMVHFIEERNLNNRIIYAGSAAGAQEYYAMADAFVSASFFEGGPLNLLEALKVNLPIIITNVGLAVHFKGMPGVQVVEPPVDINEFYGALGQLASTREFEERLATAMVETYNNPQRPNMSSAFLQAIDKSSAYQPYVKLIDILLKGGRLDLKAFSSPWLKELRKMS